MHIFHTLNEDTDFENLSIDSTSVKAHPQSAGAKKAVNAKNNQFISVSRGGKTTKIHAVVDGLGNPVHFLLSGGQVHDSKIAVDVLSSIDISDSNILGDKAYGTEKIRAYITENNAKYTIPPKANNPDPWSIIFELCKWEN